jgi:hypothetical protein
MARQSLDSTNIQATTENTIHPNRRRNRHPNRKLRQKNCNYASTPKRNRNETRRSLSTRMERHRLPKKLGNNKPPRKRKQPQNLANIQKTRRHVKRTPQKKPENLRKRKHHLFRNRSMETKKTCRSKTPKPTPAKHNLPHVKTLESHHGIPQNPRHIPHTTTLRPQNHTKHLIYITLETSLFQTDNSEFHTAVAKTVEEARKLLEVGFEYTLEIDGTKIFRKRK